MKFKSLIIDDDEIALMLTEILVKGHSFMQNPERFLDGTYALEYLKNDYSEDTVYAILLDINMPLMDGWEFLDHVDSFVSSNNVFVFMLSSSTDHEDIEKSKDINLVKGFFSKPLQNEHLDQIQQILSQ
jgi:CheY-like chemotaxis protein